MAKALKRMWYQPWVTSPLALDCICFASVCAMALIWEAWSVRRMARAMDAALQLPVVVSVDK